MFELFAKPMRQFFPAICLFFFFSSGLALAQNPVVYPLHVGDYWIYQAQIKREITKDTVMSNGYTYSKMISTDLFSTSFQRFSNDTVYHNLYGYLNMPLYDFSLEQGDTSTIVLNTDTLDIILLWTGTTNIFGRQRRQWEFYFDDRSVIDEEETHWVTDSLGLTKWADFLFSINLQGAIIDGDTFGVVTSIEEDQILTPGEFKLYQNYPNPFNASTQISFVIPKSAFVSLKIYNVLGEEIATVVSERINTGDHTYNWNAGKLSSGIYYYHLAAGDFRDVKKMLLAK